MDRQALSVRELEVLRWLGEGKKSYDIGIILDISHRTVDFHVKNITKKLNVVTRAQAVATALKAGLIMHT